MLNKLLILFLFASCGGPDVKLKKNELENLTPLSDLDKSSYRKQGVFHKSEKNELEYNGKKYRISRFSSKSSEEFIQSLPNPSSVPVVFVGGFQGDEAVIENIKKQ